MRRMIRSTKCEGCKRLYEGKRTYKCRFCCFAYTPERVTEGTYRYRNAVLTVAEWADVFHVSRQTVYRWLSEARGSIGEVIRRNGLEPYADKVGGHE